jgi:hypothetical protein
MVSTKYLCTPCLTSTDFTIATPLTSKVRQLITQSVILIIFDSFRDDWPSHRLLPSSMLQALWILLLRVGEHWIRIPEPGGGKSKHLRRILLLAAAALIPGAINKLCGSERRDSYIKYQCLSLRLNWLPSPPSPASETVSPPPDPGGDTLACGGGGANSDDRPEILALCILCDCGASKLRQGDMS